MRFEVIVSLRFLREGRFQTLLTLAGVAVGVAVIVFLSALISGLQTSLVANTLGSQPHVVVRPQDETARRMVAEGETAVAARVEKAAVRTRTLPDWPLNLTRIERVPGVVATSPIAAGAAFVVKGDVSKAVALRGVDTDRFDRIVNVSGRMKGGRFRLDGNDVVLGVGLARDLGLGIGDKVRLVTEGGRSDVFTVGGLFDLGAKDLNERWVLASIRNAQTLLNLEDGITSIEVRVDSIFDADRMAADITDRTGLVAETWMEINRPLLVGLKSQSMSSWMIQFFVVLAVALGIASVLVVAVVQKSREIGILKAIGTSTRQTMAIFLLQGGLLGLVGSALGCALGALLAIGFRSMAVAPDGSPIFPVDLTWTRFAAASTMATVVGMVAAVAPARRAARLDPAEVIRYG
jgi:lipoprotein-releasing system permease protein